MMNYISKMIFFKMMILGTLVTISSSSWLGMWMGLEINLLSFIPLMIDNKNMLCSESAIKYFLVQTLASLIFLFMCIFYMSKLNLYFSSFFSSQEDFIIVSSMMMKLGAAPLHFWLPNIIEGLSWNNTLVILTWQKIAPLMIISMTFINKFIMMFVIISSITGSVGGLNQTSLKKIMTYSSINHISWLLLANLINNTLWTFYFLFYMIMNYSIIMIFKMYNIFNMNQFFLYKSNFNLMKFCFMVNMLSLGGLPPFMGFFPKWMIIENLIMSNNLFILLILMMTALITLYFYARLTFSAFLFNYPSFSWNKLFNKNNFLLMKNLMLNFFMTFSLAIFSMNNFYLL